MGLCLSLLRNRLGVVLAVVAWASLAAAQPELPAEGAAVPPAAPAPPATYVGSKTCVTCHKEQAAGWEESVHGQKLSVPELPESYRSCEACHGPGSAHVGSTGKTPIGQTFRDPAPQDAVKACGSCHIKGAAEGVPAEWPTMDPKYWGRTLHARGGVTCLACHRIHGGEGEALQQAPEALCRSCHEDMQPKDGAYLHAPVAQGQCLACHTPHGDAPRHNLLSGAATVCVGCHSPEAEGFASAHLGYPVAQSNCLSCHDPHSTNRAQKLIAERQHAPFAAHQCEACHTTEAGNPSTSLKKPVKELCATCHPPSKTHPAKDAQGRTLRRHVPVDQGLCTICHNPHAGTQPKALKDRVDYVCFFCHAKTEEATLQTYRHKPVTTGNCLLCHRGHTASAPKLLNSDPIELCATCHATQGRFTHPVGVWKGKPVRVPGTQEMVVCTHCHDVHGSPYRGILPEEEDTLCRTCHKT